MDMNSHEAEIARQTLERYSGCAASDFFSNLILTNFPRYVERFAKTRNVPICEGSMFKVAHSPKDEVSILDFKIGSPAAAPGRRHLFFPAHPGEHSSPGCAGA